MLAGLYVYHHGTVPAMYLSNCVPKLAILQGLNGYNSVIVMCTTQICLGLSSQVYSPAFNGKKTIGFWRQCVWFEGEMNLG